MLASSAGEVICCVCVAVREATKDKIWEVPLKSDAAGARKRRGTDASFVSAYSPPNRICAVDTLAWIKPDPSSVRCPRLRHNKVLQALKYLPKLLSAKRKTRDTAGDQAGSATALGRAPTSSGSGNIWRMCRITRGVTGIKSSDNRLRS